MGGSNCFIYFFSVETVVSCSSAMERGVVVVRMKAEIMSHHRVSLSAADATEELRMVDCIAYKEAVYVCVF